MTCAMSFRSVISHSEAVGGARLTCAEVRFENFEATEISFLLKFKTLFSHLQS
jgi:hypothetical protein